jgi:molecular chaperone HscA
LREQQVEADRLLEAIAVAMQADGERLLSAEEQQIVVMQMEALIETRNGDDHHAITKQIDVLAKATDEFAARRMDDSIKRALAGKAVDNI